MKDWNVKSKKVLIRVDYNVPMDENGVITDDTRIAKSIPTLQSLSSKGARIILMSHLGRPLKALLPDGSIDKTKFSLAPAAKTIRITRSES